VVLMLSENDRALAAPAASGAVRLRRPSCGRLAPTLSLILGLAMGFVLGAGAPARAQDLLRAAAVVNDEIISMLDLDMRTRLAILATGQEATPELRRRAVQQVMRGLIDERLQAQEAQRLDITVTDDQIDNAMGELARRNKMSEQDFTALLENQGILPESLREQVHGQLLWSLLVARRLRPSVQVSEEEIQEVVDRIVANRGTTLRRVSEIFLAVDSVLQEEDVQSSAKRLIEQLHGGAEFPALARQFSQSATAPQGGEIGWVQDGQLAPELDAALATMQPNTMSSPIRTLSGFHILYLQDQRQTAVGDVALNLKQILFPIADGATEQQQQEVRARATEARGQITGCDGLEAIAADAGGPGSGDLGTVKLSDLPAATQDVVRSLPIGQPSEPVPVPGGLNVLVVCERIDTGIDRDGIREQLVNQQLDLLSRRYMRDLRRSANVDMRI
jgi:peptidyl-prolyl cis-trans isomerase SurA